MQDTIDRFCRMRDTEPNMVINQFGRYEKIVYFFNVNMVMTFEEFGNVIDSNVKEINFEHKFLGLNSVVGKKLLLPHEVHFLKRYEEWALENILLGH